MLTGLLSAFLCTSVSLAAITREELGEVVHALGSAYAFELAARDETLAVNSPLAGLDWFAYPAVHASYSTYEARDPRTGANRRHHELSFMGGMAALPEMTREGAALILCHEMGHGLGGAPYKSDGTRFPLSVEGQADDYATRVCLPRVLPLLPPTHEPRFEARCAQPLCARSFEAMESLRALLRHAWGARGETDWESPDPAVVVTIETRPDYYPSAQCRLDTLVNGALELERPACWFARG
ncbi:MAG: hypothetical protein NDJ89_15445 [Oligoflexia bacterium]|nr:hypothetical protein [Oligoflexia bacterium]